MQNYEIDSNVKPYSWIREINILFKGFLPTFIDNVALDENAWQRVNPDHIFWPDDALELKESGEYLEACKIYFQNIVQNGSCTLGWAQEVFNTLAVAGDFSDALAFGNAWSMKSGELDSLAMCRATLQYLCKSKGMQSELSAYLASISGNPEYFIDLAKTDYYTDDAFLKTDGMEKKNPDNESEGRTEILLKKKRNVNNPSHIPFDFGNANSEQKKAITTVDGPVLITAGPGTGKTFTLVQRTAYLIQERDVLPEEIMMVTFTEKAAKELITRITDELSRRGINVNIDEMYIGTFHSICLRIIKEHPEHARISSGFRVLDAFDQQYVIYRNLAKFREIPGYREAFERSTQWKQSAAICLIVNNLAEEMVDLSALRADHSHNAQLLAEIRATYQDILDEEQMMDFSALQVDAYNLLSSDAEALSSIQSQIKYIMVDEYQDTNYIQEQIVFLLGGTSQNICVVGDDDQGLYRFRGATIRNILEFPEKFPDGKCSVVSLVTNYRSNSDIVDYYNSWMMSPQISWGRFRYNKRIIPFRGSLPHSPAVARLSVGCKKWEYEPWCQKVLCFLQKLKFSGKISDYNQVAFLFRSVKSAPVLALANHFEQHGVRVYSPRANMFFRREEIMLSIGTLLMLFRAYLDKLENNGFPYLGVETINYYHECLSLTRQYLNTKQGGELSRWIAKRSNVIAALQSKAAYGLKGLLYQMLAVEPFRHFMPTDTEPEAIRTRPARNLSILFQMIGKYEFQHYMEKLNPKNLEKDIERLFNQFIKLLIEQGVDEYEDESEYAPSGCVSFLTIHQSKGLEFPVVFVGTLSDFTPRTEGADAVAKESIKYVASRYYNRSPFEPDEKTDQFDIWRLYYTAFSRAQDLLILTCAEQFSPQYGRYTPSKCFDPFFDRLPQADSGILNLVEFDFHGVKNINLKETYSFTSHVAVFDTCPRHYKLSNVYDFEPQKTTGMLFGQLVHMTIEDVHKAVLAKRTVDEIMVANVFQTDYESLKKSEHMTLGPQQVAAALEQVQRYVRRQSGKWNGIVGAEVEVSLVCPDYIIDGTIDLVMESDGRIDLYDFKTGKKDVVLQDTNRFNQYKQQLYIYAHLIEKQTGYHVNKLCLYFVGDDTDDPIVLVQYSEELVANAVRAFETSVHSIMNCEFEGTSCDIETCRECDFRYYCHKQTGD